MAKKFLAFLTTPLGMKIPIFSVTFSPSLVYFLALSIGAGICEMSFLAMSLAETEATI